MSDHVRPGDTVVALTDGTFKVTRPGVSYETHYAIHPERLPPPRLSFDDVWGTYKKEPTDPTMKDAYDAWRTADQNALQVRRLVARYFIGNEKSRGKSIVMTTDGHSSSDKVDIPLDVLFDTEDWASKLLGYARRVDLAADQARWDFAAAARKAFADWTPINRPVSPDGPAKGPRDRIDLRPINLGDDTP